VAHCLASLIAHCRGEVDEIFTVPIHRAPGTKGVPQEVELRGGVLAPTIVIFAVNDTSLVRVQLETAFLHPLLQRRQKTFRFLP
jgi:hypothetical protein